MVYKSSLYSTEGNELTIESFYFNISILDNKSNFTIVNNDTGASVQFKKSLLKAGKLEHIKAVSLVKYAYDISTGTPKPSATAKSIYETMLQIVKVCGIHNSSYNSLLREAIGA